MDDPGAIDGALRGVPEVGLAAQLGDGQPSPALVEAEGQDPVVVARLAPRKTGWSASRASGTLNFLRQVNALTEKSLMKTIAMSTAGTRAPMEAAMVARKPWSTLSASDGKLS